MNLPLVVDIAIGLIFIYLVLSLLTSEIQELITTLLQWRAVHLKESIEGLLCGNDTEQLKQARVLADRLYQSPVINTLNQEAKGFGASLPRQFTQAIGKFIRDLFKLENVFGGKRSGPSFIASESFATSFLETLGIPLVIQKFTLLRMQSFNSQLIAQVGEALQKPSIAGINETTLEWELKNKEDETQIKDFLKTEAQGSDPNQAFSILKQFYNFKNKLNDTVVAFKNGGFDLASSVDRLEEVLSQYIQGLEEYFKEVNFPQAELITNLKSIQNDEFGNPKIDNKSNSGGVQNWSTEKVLLLRSLQPNLAETVEILKGFWQLKRCWSAYKRIREGAALDAVSQLTETIGNQPNIPEDIKTTLLNNIKDKIMIGGSDYGYDKIKDKLKGILDKYPKSGLSLDNVNTIIEEAYQQIKEFIEIQPDNEIPAPIKATLLQKIEPENRKEILSSLTYEFEKVRRTEIENFRNAESEKAKTSPEENTVSSNDTFPPFIDRLDDIIETTDEIIDHSYIKIKEKILDNKNLSPSNKQSLLEDIDNITNRNLDIEYEIVRKEIEKQNGIYWLDKQNLLGQIDEIVNGYLKDEYEKFEKSIKRQPDLNLSVQQSLLLLATAITLRKDNELARLVDQLLGMGSIPTSVEQNLFLLAQQAQIKVDGVKEELNQFRKEVENWFDKSMERADGVYKRNAKMVAIIVGSVIAVAVNADTIHIVNRLSQDQILRSTVLKAAEGVATKNSDITAKCLSYKTEAQRSQDPQCGEVLSNIDQATKNISLPIGWGPSNVQQQWEETISLGFLGFLRRFLGWFVSGIALSMGASFWYELLGKFIDVRNTGKVPSPSKEQANVVNDQSPQ